MDVLPETTPTHTARIARRPAGSVLARCFQSKARIVALLAGMAFTPWSAANAPGHLFHGVLHSHGPRGVFTEIQFEPHRLIARVHAPHTCVLRAYLVHGDPHSSRYAIEPPTGGRFCDELVDGEIIIHPHSRNDVQAEFHSSRMDWSGEFRLHLPSQG
jgi:hypothetical protein